MAHDPHPQHPAPGRSLTETDISEATRPLTDAGWTPTVDGRQLRWQTKHNDVDAVHEAFAHSIARTSLIGGIIMAAGTVIVLAVLPGRRKADKQRPEDAQEIPETREPQDAQEARTGAA